MSARLILAGGGGAEDSRLLDEHFAAWVGQDGRMLYLPVALSGSGRSYAAALDWVQSVFNPLGVTQIEMWTELDAYSESELSDFSGVYIGGGNTFHLLKQMRTSGFAQRLARFIQQGGAVYGGSAGAIVLGCDISTCAHLDQNLVALTDLHGLDVVQGYAVWCHYTPGDDARIAGYVERQAVPVLAISERAGICLENDQLAPLGFEPVYRFDSAGGRRERFMPGEYIGDEKRSF